MIGAKITWRDLFQGTEFEGTILDVFPEIADTAETHYRVRVDKCPTNPASIGAVKNIFQSELVRVEPVVVDVEEPQE